MSEVLKRAGLDGRRTLLVLDQADPNLIKSCRNIKNLRTTLAHQLNPYELIACESVLLTSGGLAQVQEVLAK
jgi:ribosomal protein L4